MYRSIVLLFCLCFFSNAVFAKTTSFIDQIYYKIIDIDNIVKLVNYHNLISILVFILKIFLILFLFYTLWKVANSLTLKILKRLENKYENQKYTQDMQTIVKTVGPIIKSILHWILSGIFILILLAELNIDIMPIIYSLGVFGLAFSFGAQTLVKDIITGILTLLEGVVNVGDIVDINGIIGKVEALSLRTIDFRHASGRVEVIAYSDIRNLNNLSKDYRVCNVTFSVDFSAKYDEIKNIIEHCYEKLLKKDDIKHRIFGNLIFGINSINEKGVLIGVSFKTNPDPYDHIGKQFREILLKDLQNKNIPFIKTGCD